MQRPSALKLHQYGAFLKKKRGGGGERRTTQVCFHNIAVVGKAQHSAHLISISAPHGSAVCARRESQWLFILAVCFSDKWVQWKTPRVEANSIYVGFFLADSTPKPLQSDTFRLTRNLHVWACVDMNKLCSWRLTPPTRKRKQNKLCFTVVNYHICRPECSRGIHIP